NRHQRWLGYWSEGAVVWSLREVVGFFRNVSSFLSSGGEGLHSLASPALVVRSGGFVFLDRIQDALRREFRKLKKSGDVGGSPVSSSGVTRVSVAVLRRFLA
ncbi:unnamed protein product, partial [Brassica rapa subsp. narinosa]